MRVQTHLCRTTYTAANICFPLQLADDQVLPTRNFDVLNIIILKFTQWVRNQQINPSKDSALPEQMLDQDSKLSRTAHSSQGFCFRYHTDLLQQIHHFSGKWLILTKWKGNNFKLSSTRAEPFSTLSCLFFRFLTRKAQFPLPSMVALWLPVLHITATRANFGLSGSQRDRRDKRKAPLASH